MYKCVCVCVCVCVRERETETERDRERETETETEAERNIILKSFIKLKHQLMKLRLSTSLGETYRCALFCNLESLQPAKITY